RRTFVDGDDVCILYDMVTNTPAGPAFICEWYRVRGDKIGSIRAVFDARPFAPMSNRRSFIRGSPVGDEPDGRPHRIIHRGILGVLPGTREEQSQGMVR